MKTPIGAVYADTSAGRMGSLAIGNRQAPPAVCPHMPTSHLRLHARRNAPTLALTGLLPACRVQHRRSGEPDPHGSDQPQRVAEPDGGAH